MVWTKYSLTDILDKVILGSIRGLSVGLGDSIGTLGSSDGLGSSVGLLLLIVVGLRGGRWDVSLILLNVVVSVIGMEEEGSIKIVDDGSEIGEVDVIAV